MRQRLVYILVGIALVLGMITLPHAPAAQAGSSGQQIQFYNYSGKSSISYLYVSGWGWQNPPLKQTWSRTFSPSVMNYSLSGWWWQGDTYVSWRMADGRTGSCPITIPKTLSANWVQVGVDRQPGNTCYFSDH